MDSKTLGEITGPLLVALNRLNLLVAAEAKSPSRSREDYAALFAAQGLAAQALVTVEQVTSRLMREEHRREVETEMGELLEEVLFVLHDQAYGTEETERKIDAVVREVAAREGYPVTDADVAAIAGEAVRQHTGSEGA